MNIRQKILFSLIAVVLLMFISLGSVLVFHTTSLSAYKKVSNNLILEDALSEKVVSLVEAYNALVIAPASSERMDAYLLLQGDIKRIISELDAEIENPDTKVAYEGLKMIISNILADTDSGLAELQAGDMTAALDYYNDALYKKGFVIENTATLLLTEIQHLHEIQQVIEARYGQQLFIVSIWVMALALSTVVYAFVFARRITNPIKKLSLASEKVSKGDYALRISDDILNRQDEVGSLGKSFNFMLEKLNLKITQVEAANSVVLETKKHLEERNSELERYNKMVIGRELKMVELKKQIQSLETQVRQLQSER